MKKVSFKIAPDLHEKHLALMVASKEAGYKMDLTSDFVKWFKTQLTTAERHLKGEPAKVGRKKADK
jgi:hypothetical protein